MHAEIDREVYEELRSLARGLFAGLRPGDTLQPTALVHEAYLRLARPEASRWHSRGHFVAVAVRAMRQILTDHFRRQKAAKRGGDWRRVTLSQAGAASPSPVVDYLALEEALEELGRLDPEQVRIVELRFFGDLSVQETADVLGVSKSTVEKEWRAARAWLLSRLDTRTRPPD